MLIEFCCPACTTPLAVKEDVAGGQVNCPHCQKLILIPDSSLFGRTAGVGPFDVGRSHEAEAVKKAIAISVEPYRRELEAKANLLNEAVEMVKTRNRRIREIESLILKVQKDLWELEVEQEEAAGKEASAPVSSQEELEGHNRLLNEQMTKLQVRNEVLKVRLARALESLTETHEHLHEETELARELEEQIGALREQTPALLDLARRMEGEHAALKEGRDLLRKAGAALARGAAELTTRQSGEVALRRSLEELEASLRAQEASWQEKETAWQEKETAWRAQEASWQEKETFWRAQETSWQEKEASWQEKEASWQEKEASWRQKEEESRRVEAELRREQKAGEARRVRLQEELTEQEERLQAALKTQQTLADQSLKMENERKDLKRRLEEALETIVVLESRG